MVLPLETLPGWPDVETPSFLEVLGLLVGAPLLVVLIVAVITRVHHAVKGNVGTPAVANQPIWVNGRRIEAAAQEQSSRDSIEAGRQVASDREDANDQKGADDQNDADDQKDDASKGGAGARW